LHKRKDLNHVLGTWEWASLLRQPPKTPQQLHSNTIATAQNALAVGRQLLH
ncbi:hypothetical protein IRJ41_005878, partial [Triplophysa rosa]